MDELMNGIQRHIETVEAIGTKIEQGETYLDELICYLPSLNQMITGIFEMLADPNRSIELSEEFVLQVLNDIMYGVEQKDSVFLLDVLRYGLLEIYYYIAAELQSEG